MITDVIQILNQEGASIVNDIRENLRTTGTDATGKTARSLRYEVIRQGDAHTLRVIGRPYFMTVETGRKPTPNKKPSPSMVENIKQWMQARNMEQGMAYAVAMEINKKGSKLWRDGGRKDIVSNVISESRFEAVERDLLKLFANMFVVNIKQMLK